MRALIILAVVLVAGCVSAPPTTMAPITNSTNASANAPAAGANATPIGMGERTAMVAEHFVLTSDHALGFQLPGAAEAALAKVPEAFTGVAFFTSGDAASTLKPWLGPQAQRSFEAFGDVSITLRITSAQPAASATKTLQFSPVGGWLGTKDRWAVYFSALDAPDTLEAGKTYTLKMTAKLPASGFFVKQGEQFTLHTYLGYQTPDNSPLSYVVGGPDAAGFALPHVHFNFTAPTSTALVDKSGALSPNPTQSTTGDQQPTDIAFDVPLGTVYVVADLLGASSGGGTVDADLALRAGGETLGAGVGPSPHEVVELGPTALAKAGGKLVAHVTGATPTGGTFKLTVTAYGP